VQYRLVVDVGRLLAYVFGKTDVDQAARMFNGLNVFRKEIPGVTTIDRTDVTTHRMSVIEARITAHVLSFPPARAVQASSGLPSSNPREILSSHHEFAKQLAINAVTIQRYSNGLR
jgi:hypothetical protein